MARRGWAGRCITGSAGGGRLGHAARRSRIAQRIEEQRELIALWGTEVNGIVEEGKEETRRSGFGQTLLDRGVLDVLLELFETPGLRSGARARG